MAESLDDRTHSRLLVALAEADAAHRLDRKLLVCRRRGEGRELLRALASAVPWVGWEVETPWSLAVDLVGDVLADRGLRVADDFEQLGWLDEALDDALSLEGGLPWREMGEGAGLRRAVVEAVRALRQAGLSPTAVQRARLRDGPKAALLEATLSIYETRLGQAQAVDTADVFRLAAEALEAGAQLAPAFLLPGHDRRGLSGRLLDRLVARGATVLETDPVMGLARPEGRLAGADGGAPPTALLSWLHDVTGAPGPADGTEVELYAAASSADELREALRRVIDRGLRWDEVEIVATDPVSYGVALDGLSRRLGIPVTHAVGLPVERTRPGRALQLYLRWIEEDFPADVLWGLLERGDLQPDPPVPGVEPADLARRLRDERIGRGRARTLAALAAAERRVRERGPREGERDPEDAERRRRRERAEVEALVSLLRPVLEATPALPEDGGATEARVSPAALARGAQCLLEYVPVPQDALVDATARKRLVARLGRLAATAVRETTLSAALGWLRERAAMRVPAPEREGAAPWISAGGHIHFSDVEYGGLSGRRHTFVVGLDASRFPGTGLEDALLTDDDRWRLSGNELGTRPSTAADRVQERRWALAETLARLRGRVTLSFADWEAVDGRALAPATELLQALRLRERRADLDYSELRERVPRASAIPGPTRLDGADVWLGAIAHDGVLRRAVDLVRALHPGLDRGLAAVQARDSDGATAHDGFVAPRTSFDLTAARDVVLSASRMEMLGRCPQRFLLNHVLRVRPPDDPDVRTDRWLSALDRGSLLHTVYERTLARARHDGIAPSDATFETLAFELLAAEIAWWRQRVPVPGEALFRREAESLREDVRAFVEMVRDDVPDWVDLEREFGSDRDPPVEIDLRGGVLRLRGRIDRVDRRGDELAVVDYKTGSTFEWGRTTGVFAGGRRLQHALYAAVAEKLYGQTVAGAEYHFPTRRAMNRRFGFARAELADAAALLELLVDGVAAGRFPPTEDDSDCTFCDYAEVCRVGEKFGKTYSPRARWSRANIGRLDELATLNAVRRFER